MDVQTTDESEAQLMKAVAAGDTPAFTTLVTTHLPAIHHYALRLADSRADADDLAQDTFLAARTRARSYAAPRKESKR